MSISHPAGNAAEAELTTTLMPNIPEPKRHFCHFWYVPNYPCTQYPVFPSSLTPTLYSKQVIPPRGPGTQSSICHIQTTTDQVTTEKKDPARNEKWKVSYLCKHLSVTFPLPLPEVQELMEAPGHPSPTGSHSTEHSNPAEIPTLRPHSNTSAKALRQPHDGNKLTV